MVASVSMNISESYHKVKAKTRGLIATENSNQALVKAIAVAVVLGGALQLSVSYSEAAPDFTEYAAGDERKQAFFDYFLPIIEEENEDILTVRSDLLEIYEDKEQLSFLAKLKVASLAETYEVEEFDFASDSDWNTLIRRVDIVPPSLAIAQAANESAWGTSRFAAEGNNYFGQWCFVEGCGIVPELRPEGEIYEVADFASPAESVEAYLRNINHHPAYQTLRQKRAQLRNSEDNVSGLQLVSGLTNYSERGEEYVEELRSMIRFNELDKFDS